MTNQNSKLAAAALCAFFGGLTPSHAQQAAPAPQTAPAQQAGANTDACQPAPKGAAPQGKHWYYHTDRSAGRKCWYLGDAGMKTTTSRVATQPKTSSTPATPDADATAAAPSPTPAAKQTATAPVQTQRAPVATSETGTTSGLSADNNEPATTQATTGSAASTPLLTQQWPDADAFRPSQTTGAATSFANSPEANSPPANLQPPNSQAPSPAPSAAPPPSTKSATAPLTPSATPSDQSASLASWGTILGALFFVLAFAGLLGFITFRYLGRTGAMVSNTPNRRRDIWGNSGEETPPPAPSYADMIAPSRHAFTARTPKTPQDLDEIEQLLRRAAREPAPANANSRVDPAGRARTPTTPSAARASVARLAEWSRPR